MGPILNRAASAGVAFLVLLGATGCHHAAPLRAGPTPTPVATAAADEPCPVTKPSGARPPRVAVMNFGSVLTTDRHGWIGRGGLWVQLPPKGVLDTQLQDGFLQAKFPWFRATPGQVVVTGQPMDSTWAPFKADVGTVPEYGPTGFTAGGLSFGRAGCWRITGKLGRSELSFIIRVAPPNRH